VELLNKAKTLISSYSYDEAIIILAEFLNSKANTPFEKIENTEIQAIKESFDLILQIIDLKNDMELKNTFSLKKIIFLSKSFVVDDASENILEIEKYFLRTKKQFSFVLNILWKAYFKIGELEKATVVAERHLKELIAFKHYSIDKKNYQEIKKIGIRVTFDENASKGYGIRQEEYLEKCILVKKENRVKELVNFLYEAILFFDDETFLSEITDLAVERQDKNLLLATEGVVRALKISNIKIEQNLKRYSNFSDQRGAKVAETYDFGEDLFKKKSNKQNVMEVKPVKELVKFTNEERRVYLEVADLHTTKDLLNLVDNEDNFLELAGFYLELGLNRKSVALLEKYLIKQIDEDKRRKLYYLYVMSLYLCGEKGLAKKTLDDYCANASFLSEEKSSLLKLLNQMESQDE